MENIKVPQTTLVYPLSGSIVIRNIRNREVFLFCKSGKHVQNLNTPLKGGEEIMCDRLSIWVWSPTRSVSPLYLAMPLMWPAFLGGLPHRLVSFLCMFCILKAVATPSFYLLVTN